MKNYREMAEDVLRRAEKETQTIQRRRRRGLLIGVPAVCGALALAVLLWPKAGKAQGRNNEQLESRPQAESTELSPQTTERRPAETQDPSEHRLAGAMEALGLPAETIRDPVFGSDAEQPYMTGSDLVRSINANTTLRGVVTALDTVRVEAEDGTVWYLAAGTVAVQEVLTGRAPDEVRIVCAAAYGGGVEAGMVPIPQLADCRVGAEAVFVLRAVDGDSVWTIDQREVRPAVLGDYTVIYRLEQAGNELIYPEQGLAVRYLPAMELPDPEESVELDMIGLVVYNGAIYTQARDYYGGDAEAVRGLIGDYLGRAKGNIDEWSTQDEYAVEFASDLVGDVYTVVGYSPDFRICVTNRGQTAEGEQLWIQMLERLNGIALSKGADLYADRLQIEGRIAEVRYQTYDDWNNGGGYLQPFEHTEALDAFLEALGAGEFVWVYDDDPGFYRNTRTQAFLWLTLEDGTVVGLRLIEGGWVGYDAMPWYFVRIPEEAFDAVFSLCR